MIDHVAQADDWVAKTNVTASSACFMAWIMAAATTGDN
jgi:hypothetical protein